MPVGIGSQAKQQRWGRGSGRRGAGATTADEASTRAHPAPPNLKKGSRGAGGGEGGWIAENLRTTKRGRLVRGKYPFSSSILLKKKCYTIANP